MSLQKNHQGVSIIILLRANAVNSLNSFLSIFFDSIAYSPLEFIIIDKAAAGGTEESIDSYITKAFIRLIKGKQNLSLAGAKKLAPQKARFNRIVYIDMHEASLEWSGDFMEQPGNTSEKGDTDQFIKRFKARLEPYGNRHESRPTPQDHSALNVLLVNKGRMETNSGYHVKYYAERLCSLGAHCIVAVPKMDESDQARNMPFEVRTYKDILQNGLAFKNGRGPDVVHAWTPREKVRKFCLDLANQYSFKTVIHLEDNEEYLTENTLGRPYKELAALSAEELDQLIPNDRFHPIRGWQWLNQADGLTYIIDTLAWFNTNNLPSMILPAPVDERLFYPRPINYELRKELDIPEDHTVLAYIGNIRPLKKQEALAIYKAVKMLNDQGIPTTLIRTGKNYVSLAEDESRYQKFEKPLGWVSREQVPEILAAADILVQPGWPGPFDDQRIPAKLPEYFAMGRPVILPRANLGLKAEQGREGYVLEKADAEGIVKAVKEICENKELRNKLADTAVDFYLEKLSIGGLRLNLNHYYHSLIDKLNKQRTNTIPKKPSVSSKNKTETRSLPNSDKKQRNGEIDREENNLSTPSILSGATFHSSDYWEQTISSLRDEFSADIQIISCLENNLLEGKMPYRTPWIGFVHAWPVKVPKWLSMLSPYNELSNGHLFKSEAWKNAKNHCKGLYVFSNEHAQRLQTLTDLPVHVVQKPLPIRNVKWNWQTFEAGKNKKIIQLGWWFQRIHALSILPANEFQKVWIKTHHPDLEAIIQAENKHLKGRYIYFDYMAKTVETRKSTTLTDFQKLMRKGIFFGHYYDGTPLDLVLECVAHRIPILINPYASIREYLDDDYPLYYYFYKDAVAKASDLALVRRAHEHLKNREEKIRNNMSDFKEIMSKNIAGKAK